MHTLAERRLSLFGWRFLLFFFHLTGIVAAVFLSLHIRFPAEDVSNFLTANLKTFVAFICLSPVFFFVAGLYDFTDIQNVKKTAIRSLAAVTGTAVATIIFFYGRLSLPMGRGAFLLFSTFAATFSFLTTLAYGLLFSRPFVLHRLGFFSGDPVHQKLINLIHTRPQFGYAVSRVFADTNPDRITTSEIDTMVLPGRSISPQMSNFLRFSRFNGIEIYDPLTLYGELTGQIPVDYLTEQWLFSAAMAHSHFHTLKLKRLLDILCSSFGLLLFGILFPFLALLIKLDSKGPVFYKQERVGRNGRLFILLKLRTMFQGAEKKDQAVWAKKSDPRITRVGRFLRSLRLDEIPQLLNVLRGEMSLVGPRPERLQFVEELSKKIPFYEERLLLQPGLTGWAQVNFRYAGSLEDSKTKLQYDLYYYKNISLWLDLSIFLRTVRTILTASGQ